MAKVFVGIGSNMDKRANIVGSVRALREHFGELVLSPVYESDAVGFEGDSFYNMVAAFETAKPPEEITEILAQIERAHGRQRGEERFCSRTLDLDQLLHGDLVADTEVLCLPHTDIMKYAFVLCPLADVAGDLVHAGIGKTYAQLWRERAPDAPTLVEVVLTELHD